MTPYDATWFSVRLTHSSPPVIGLRLLLSYPILWRLEELSGLSVFQDPLGLKISTDHLLSQIPNISLGNMSTRGLGWRPTWKGKRVFSHFSEALPASTTLTCSSLKKIMLEQKLIFYFTFFFFCHFVSSYGFGRLVKFELDKE